MPQSLLQQDVNEELRRHFDSLGVSTVAGYKLWCHRHELNTTLDKSSEALMAEREVHKHEQQIEETDAGPEHNPRRAKIMAQIFKGALEDTPLTEVPSRVRQLYNNLADDIPAGRPLDNWSCMLSDTRGYSSPLTLSGS